MLYVTYIISYIIILHDRYYILYIQLYKKNKAFISKRVIFQFLPNLRRLSKIKKTVKNIIKSINLKSN